MARYFMALAYCGTAYHGWQIQHNAYTVQQAVQESIGRLLGPITVTGSGRTDTGVHAYQQVVHFDWPHSLDTEFCLRLNAVLPLDISAYRLHEVPSDRHARHSARRRSYEYYLHTHKNPLATNRSYFFRPPLRIDLMEQAAQQLVACGEHDYQCFSRARTQQNHFRCRITRATWTVEDTRPAGQQLIFHISANRFLRGMVRAVVGTMLDIGTERSTLDDLHRIIKSRDRQQAGRAVPAHGLYLTEVSYD